MASLIYPRPLARVCARTGVATGRRGVRASLAVAVSGTPGVLREAGILELIRTDPRIETDRYDFLYARNWIRDVGSAYENPDNMPAMLKFKFVHLYTIYKDMGEKYGWL